MALNVSHTRTEDFEEKVDTDAMHDKNKLPIDRGWAWVIVAAAFCINLIHVGYFRAFGILFVEILEEFRAPTSVTSLIMGVYSATYSLLSLVVLSVVLDRYSVRAVCVLGGLLLSLGSILGYWAMNLEYLIFTQGILTGSGSALLYTPAVVMIGHYFDKRQALAQAISSCGVSVGGMIVPQITRSLISEYGLRGTLLISGGILLHIVIFALLYRPAPRKPVKEKKERTSENELNHLLDCPEIISITSLDNYVSSPPTPKIGIRNGHSYDDEPSGSSGANVNPLNISYAKLILMKQGPFRPRTESDPTRFLDVSGNTRSSSVPRDQFLSNGNMDRIGLANSAANISGEKVATVCSVRPSQANLGHNYLRNRSSHNHLGSVLDTISQSSYLKYASNADLHVISTFSLNTPSLCIQEVELIEEKTSCYQKLRSAVDLSVFRMPHFYLIAGYSVFAVLSISLYASYLPAYAQETGLSEVQSALLITIYAGVDLVSRFMSGIIVESGRIRPHHLLAVCMAAVGVMYQLTSFYTSMNTMIMYAVLFGTFSGCMPAIHPVVMIEFLGIENFPKALGFIQIFHGVAIGGMYPLLGAVRDVTGSYQLPYNLLGLCAFMSALLLLVEPLVNKCKTSKEVKVDCDELKGLTELERK